MHQLYTLFTMPPLDEDDNWTVALKRPPDTYRAWTGTGYDEEEALLDIAHNIVDSYNLPAASTLPTRLHPFLLEAVNHRIESAKERVQDAINRVGRGWTTDVPAIARHSTELKMYEDRKESILASLLTTQQTTGD